MPAGKASVKLLDLLNQAIAWSYRLSFSTCGSMYNGRGLRHLSK